jgi:radical SAM superfamily enzyme with C-terminal helix-hairpin-helix motif
VAHGFRSVTGIPSPLRLNSVGARLLRALPKISDKEVLSIMRKRPIKNLDELKAILHKDGFEAVKPMIELS